MKINRATKVRDPETGGIVHIPAGEVPARYEDQISNPRIIVDERAEERDEKRRARLEGEAKDLGVVGWARMGLDELEDAVSTTRSRRPAGGDQRLHDHPTGDNGDPAVDAEVERLVDKLSRDQLDDEARKLGIDPDGFGTKAEVARAILTHGR